MVVTVEPGIYFCPTLLLPAFNDLEQSKFLVQERLLECFDFGGVRLEDNVVVTGSGADSMTDVPRTVAEVEAVMSGAEWPPV